MSCLLPASSDLLTQTTILDQIYFRNPQELMCTGIKVVTPPNYSDKDHPILGVYSALPFSILQNYWKNGSQCPTTYQVGIYSGLTKPSPSSTNTGLPPGNFNTQAYQQIQREVEYLIWYYTTSNGNFNPDIYSSSVFQNEIISMCVTIPGVCQLSQAEMCRGCGRESISNSLMLLEYCGCYAAVDSQFNSTSEPQCDYLCTTTAASKLRDSTNGEVLQCSQTSCVINNITINGTTTSSVGSITFEQVCSQCTGSNNCKCYIDVSTPGVSALGIGGVNLESKCPYSQCYTTDQNGNNPKTVNCSDYLSPPPSFSFSISPEFWWFLGIFFVLVTFLIFSFAMWGDEFRQSSFTLWKPIPLKESVKKYSSKNLPP